MKENGNGDASRRRPAVIVAVLVLAVAVICGGGLWWHNHTVREHDQAFTSYRAAVRDYASQEGRYRSYLDSDKVQSASAIKEEEVSDAKTVLAMSRDVRTTKPASSRKASAKTALTGDASTGELKKATENLAAQITRMKTEVRTIKAKVLAVNTSKAHKLLSDAIGNADKTLADSNGKVPDGNHSRDELTKTLDSAKKTLEDRKSVLKTFADAKTALDTKTQAVNNAVNAKAAQDAVMPLLLHKPKLRALLQAVVLHTVAVLAIEHLPGVVIVLPLVEVVTALLPVVALPLHLLLAVAATLLGLELQMVLMLQVIGKATNSLVSKSSDIF